LGEGGHAAGRGGGILVQRPRDGDDVGNPDVNFNEERAMVIAADYPCDSSPSTGLNTSQERGNDR